MALNLVLAVFLLYGLTATSFFKSRHHAPQTAVNGSSEAGGENAATASSDAKTSSKTGSMTQPASPAEAQSQTSGAQADTAATATGTHTASAAPPAGTAATGGNTVSLPAYGVTNYLPAGVPGVTTPVTTTLPGQGIYLDGKPALLTSPIGVTLN